jgi:predicted CopG family antitoxin
MKLNQKVINKDKLLKHKIKLFKFWMSHNFKSVNIIEPEIKHNDIEYFHSLEVLKVFRDDNLSLIKEELSIEDIFKLDLPIEDKVMFIKFFQPNLYKELLKIKDPEESFSELFLRLIRSKNNQIEKCFGAWDLTSDEKEQIWDDIARREGRIWNHSKGSEIK